MEYRYEAYTTDKRIVRGSVDASSENAAEGVLYRAGYSRVLRLKETNSRYTLEQLFPSIFEVKIADVIEFSRQLATLIESGIPIITALTLLEKQEHRAALKKVISGVSGELEGGKSFSEALSRYPRVFSNIYCRVIKASEYTGNLATSLRQAASYIEKNVEIKSKIRQALAYPTLVALMSIGVVVLIVNVAFPPLVRLFASLGAQLPWTTSLLLHIAAFVSDYKLYLLAGLVACILLVVSYIRLPGRQLLVAKLILKIPRIGHIIVLRNMHQFCRTMSLMLEAGVPLPNIMSSVVGTVSNRIIRKGLVEVRQKLVQGQGLSQPMTEAGLFPELLVEMVVIGEKTGALPSTLASVADLYERKIEQEVRTLIAMIQNTLLLVIAIVVGFIGVSMITPLYSMLKTVH